MRYVDNSINYNIIKTYGTTRGGKCANVRLYSIASLVAGLAKGISRTTQIAEIDGGISCQLCQLELEDFEHIFSDIDVTRMQVNGVLDYYPDGYNTWGDIISREVNVKYPIFSAKIYKKYGIKRLPTDKREEWS